MAREVAITVGQKCAHQLSCLFTVVRRITIDHVGTEPIEQSHFLIKFASFGEFSSFLF